MDKHERNGITTINDKEEGVEVKLPHSTVEVKPLHIVSKNGS
jgi:hypothetical protein